jgi:putative redox protein
MQATARRDDRTFKHTVQVGGHQLTVDEPVESGGEDTGPHPQELLAVSLASCTAITMEMYAARKGWDIGHVEVDAEYTPAAKCPVHRVLDGEVMFGERVERTHMAT